MTTATHGDTVRIHYTGTVSDGTVFDSAVCGGRVPLAVTLGAGDAIPGVEEALIGMTVGEQKTVTVPPEKAYGEYNPNIVIEYPRESIPGDMELFVGQQLKITTQNDKSFIGRVHEIRDDNVVLDGNHPLAGKALKFDLELVDIETPSVHA